VSLLIKLFPSLIRQLPRRPIHLQAKLHFGLIYRLNAAPLRPGRLRRNLLRRVGVNKPVTYVSL
jgi:hypothetical protein